MDYPVDFTFKILALAPQIAATDASGKTVCYVKQKLFKLKEAVNVFTGRDQKTLLCTIQADRILDISATYNFADSGGAPLGGVKRHGLKSIWRTRYDILSAPETVAMTITEENPWVKVADALFEQIPVAGMFSGYVLHPSYLVAREDGAPVMRIRKQSAFLEGKFRLEKLARDLTEEDELRVLLSLLMMILLERRRG